MCTTTFVTCVFLKMVDPDNPPNWSILAWEATISSLLLMLKNPCCEGCIPKVQIFN